MKKYSIGIDYGTLSARALLIDLETGLEAYEGEFVYPHAILESAFFDGITLEKEAALQHPQDYLDALSHLVGEILKVAAPEEIVGIGFDFTSCTVLPVTADGTPLCFFDEFKNNPQAYVKLWKHHGGQAEADKMTELAKKENEPWLESYGGKVSSEWLFPKLYETYRKAPEVYAKTVKFLEAGEWLVWMLTGEEIRSACMAGYKAQWNANTGYPPNSFWKKLDPGFGDIIGTKVSEKVLPTGSKAGEVASCGEKLTGLKIGTTVAVPIIDAHSALPAAGVVRPGSLMLIIGTSGCHIVMNEEEKEVPGICGSVRDGIIPGLVAYEAGQTCVGDAFDWFINNCVPEKYAVAARSEGKSVFAYVTEKAKKLAVGESRLLALDWWNGNRTPYADFDLSGMIVGLRLTTKPEEIFRALIESTAFGTKAIVDLYEENGIEISEIVAGGGISQKNALLMQIYADVLGKEIKVTDGAQSGAKGGAIFAAVAGGFFATPESAAEVIADKCTKTYTPKPENTKKYEKIYREYISLSEYFANKNPVMKEI